MEKQTQIRKLINSVRSKGVELTADNVIIESLFHSGGTLTEADKDDILEIFWQIREDIERRVKRKYPDGDGIAGFAYDIAVNAYFKRK